jgi:hypothetical protein
MQFYTKQQPSGMIEYRAVVTQRDGRAFAYWCQRDNHNVWSNDFAVVVAHQRYIIGYMDHDEDERFKRVHTSKIPREAMFALMFAMTEEFDTSGDSGLDFYIK